MKRIIKTIGTIEAILIAMFIGHFYGSVQKVIDGEFINMKSEEFRNNFVDIRQATVFKATENGLQLSKLTHFILHSLNCGEPSFGGAMYGCGKCGTLKFVPLSQPFLSYLCSKIFHWPHSGISLWIIIYIEQSILLQFFLFSGTQYCWFTISTISHLQNGIFSIVICQSI